MEHRAQRAACNREAGTLEGLLVAVEGHDVVAPTHHDMGVKPWTVVTPINDTGRTFRCDDVLAVSRDQGLEHEALYDQMLPDVLDVCDDLPITKLLEVLERVIPR